MHCWKREALTEKILVQFQLCNVQNPEQNRTAAFGGVGVGSSGKMLKKSKGVITVKVTVSSPLGEKEGVTERERERKGGHCPAPLSGGCTPRKEPGHLEKPSARSAA